MKFYNTKCIDGIYITAYGRGKDAGVRIQKPDTHYAESINLFLELDEVRQFVNHLQKAIEAAEKRIHLNEDEED